MSDSAVLHITLSHIAMGLRSLLSIELGPDIIYHLGRAVAIVNKRIANFRYETIAIKDKTIFTVSFLTHWEVRTFFASTFLVIVANTTTLLDQIWFCGWC